MQYRPKIIKGTVKGTGWPIDGHTLYFSQWDYLNNVLHLELNGKTAIGLVKHGITFVGCRIFPGYRKPTKQSVKKMKARMRYIAKEYEAGLIDFDAVDATMQSYFGMLSHCSTHGLQKWIEKNIVFKRKEPAAEAKEVNLWT